MERMEVTLLGSFMMRYLPGGCSMHLSMMTLRMPQELSILRVMFLANSSGVNCCVPRMTCLVESRTWARLT